MPVIITAALALLYFGLRAYRRAEYQVAVEALRATGAATAYSDLVGEPIPDAENSAPIWTGVFADLAASDTAGIDRPLLGSFLTSSYRRDHPESWGEARRAVQQVADVFPRVEEAARLPRYWVQAEPTNESLGTRQMETLMGLRSVALLLAARALLRARDGDACGAADDLIVLLRASGIIRSNSVLLDFLARQSLIKLCLMAVYDVMECEGVGPAEAARLSRELQSIDLSEEFRAATLGEAAFCVQRDTGLKRLIEPFVLHQTTSACRELKRQIEGARLSYADARAMRLAEQPRATLQLPLKAWAVEQLYRNTNFSRYMVRADVACAVTYLALHAHRAQRGAWPETLAELKQTVSWYIPEDPFTGSELVYEPHGDEFTLSAASPAGTTKPLVCAGRWQTGALRLDYQLGSPTEHSASPAEAMGAS